jgi:hypothetical protein
MTSPWRSGDDAMGDFWSDVTSRSHVVLSLDERAHASLDRGRLTWAPDAVWHTVEPSDSAERTGRG